MTSVAHSQPTPPQAMAPNVALPDINQRISTDLRLLTCVGLICTIALAILCAASSQTLFAYLSIAGTGVIFRSYQEIESALNPPANDRTAQMSLFKLTQVKMGELVTFIGESLSAAGRHLSG